MDGYHQRGVFGEDKGGESGMQEKRIAREILVYLLDHPEAKDTLDGIVEWGLLERKIKYQTDIVKQALAELVGRGLILEYKGGDSRIRYRMNQDRHEEIRSFLRRNKEEVTK